MKEDKEPPLNYKVTGGLTLGGGSAALARKGKNHGKMEAKGDL